MDFKKLTIGELRQGIDAKSFSAREVVMALMGEIEANADLGAFLEIFGKDAEAEAEAVDRAIADGMPLGPLAGIPIALKDNMAVSGKRVTAGSKILERYVASYDATVVKKLREAGAIIIGRTNMDEFAMGSSTETSAYFKTKNPFDRSRVPGGSSGGSAAAVGAGLVPAALGSDTGGSIRQPAAYCGAVGFKPTYGAVSRFGLFAMASSLDQIGPITRTVADAARVFDAIRGADPRDSTSTDADYGNLLNPDMAAVKQLKIGVPKEYFIDGIDANVARAVESALDKFRRAGFSIKEVSLPHTQYALSVYYIIMPAEVSTNLARFDGIRYGRAEGAERLIDIYRKTKGEGFGPEVIRRILLGTFVLSAGYYDAFYGKAQRVRRLIADDFHAAFDPASGVDVLFAPTTANPPFRFGEKSADPLSMYLEDLFTLPVNLAGLPAISIPVERIAPEGGKLPVGFQLIGRHFREADILGLGQWYEEN